MALSLILSNDASIFSLNRNWSVRLLKQLWQTSLLYNCCLSISCPVPSNSSSTIMHNNENSLLLHELESNRRPFFRVLLEVVSVPQAEQNLVGLVRSASIAITESLSEPSYQRQLSELKHQCNDMQWCMRRRMHVTTTKQAFLWLRQHSGAQDKSLVVTWPVPFRR